MQVVYHTVDFSLTQGLAKLPGGTGKLPAGLDLGLPDKDQGSLNRLGPGKIVNKPPPPSDGSKKPDPLVTLDLCYYLGDDVLNSHIKYFDWYDGSLESYKTYVNLLTLEAMKILSEMQLHNRSYSLVVDDYCCNRPCGRERPGTEQRFCPHLARSMATIRAREAISNTGKST